VKQQWRWSLIPNFAATGRGPVRSFGDDFWSAALEVRAFPQCIEKDGSDMGFQQRIAVGSNAAGDYADPSGAP